MTRAVPRPATATKMSVAAHSRSVVTAAGGTWENRRVAIPAPACTLTAPARTSPTGSAVFPRGDDPPVDPPAKGGDPPFTPLPGGTRTERGPLGRPLAGLGTTRSPVAGTTRCALAGLGTGFPFPAPSPWVSRLPGWERPTALVIPT